MLNFVYKVPGGKLLKIRLELDSDLISEAEVRGDFFMYPEDGLALVEGFLVGCNPSEDFSEELDLLMSGGGIEAFGFSGKDIFDAINQ